MDFKTFTPTLTNEDLAVLDTNNVYTNVSEQDIYKINFLYGKENKIRKVGKGHRNNMLFNWGITIRNINPTISVEALAKNIYWLYVNRCVRSDDFNVSHVCSIAINVFKEDLSLYETLGKRSYLITPKHKHLSRSEKSKELGKARRKTRDEKVLGNYDFTKSVTENAKDLEVSSSTIRNSLADNGIKTPTQEKYYTFVKIYTENPNASVRELVKITRLADKTIQRYKKRLESL